MHFTQEDYIKIENWLHRNSVKDTEFQEALPFTGKEIVTVVQDGHNRKVNIQEFINQLYKHGVEDFLNITNTYRANNITLKEAIRLIPAEARKEGQVITFLNTDGNWEIYQFIGKLNQWNNPTLWNNPFDWEKFIVDSILPDEEDLTKSAPDANGNAYLSLKDRKYEPDKYSGLGRKILRRRVIEIEDPVYGTQEKNLLLQADFEEDTTIYVVRYDFTLNGQDITLPDNSYIEYEGGSISDGNIIDRAGGLNRVVLKKNIVNGKNILTQEMVSKSNTIYEIRYDFDLNGAKITIPEGCVLDFQGGSLSDGTINCQGSFITAPPIQIFNLSIDVKGYSGWFYPEWYGAIGDGKHDDTSAIQKLNGKNILLSEKEYLCTSLEFNSYTNIKGVHKFNSCLKQAKHTTGDFIRLVDWFAGTMDTLRVEGDSTNIRGDNRWNGLVKVVNFTYEHAPNIGGWEDRDTSTNYSRLNNILIRNAAYSGLVVIGKYEIDNGKDTAYNWIHHFGDIHIVNANEYGIYDSATDNLWQFINVTHCGWANIYCVGSAEQFSTLKLDGESGFTGDEELSEIQLSNDEYKYAGLIILGSGNQFINLEVQSPLQVGIKLQGNNNIIQGNVNNWRIGVNEKITNEHKFPALQFLSKKIENNFIQLSTWPGSTEISGTCPIYWSDKAYLDAHYYKNNSIHIEYKNPKEDFDYSDFLNTLAILESEGNVVENIRYTAQNKKDNSSKLDKALDQSPNLYIAYKDGEYFKLATKEQWNELSNSNIAAIGVYVELGENSFIISKDNLGETFVLANEGENMEFMPHYYEGESMSDFSGVKSTLLRQKHQINSPNTDIFHAIKDFKIDNAPTVSWYVPSAGEAYIMYLHRKRINQYLTLIGGTLIGTYDSIATSTIRDGYYCYSVLCNNGLVYPHLATVKQATRPITKGTGYDYNNLGSDDERPTTNLYIGRQFFNKTLKKPIWWSGAGWVDATGAIV